LRPFAPSGAIASLIVVVLAHPTAEEHLCPSGGDDGVSEEAGDQSHEQPVGQEVWAAGLGRDADQLGHHVQDGSGAPRRSKALAALCVELTDTATRYPGTDLTLAYSVKSHPETA
jgi:hypothetical protein